MPDHSTGASPWTPLPRQSQRPWLRRALIFAIAVVLVDALVGESGLAETIKARRQYAEARGSLRTLRHENAGLRQRARLLTWDPGAIEAVAREELGLIRPGEVLFVVKSVR